MMLHAEYDDFGEYVEAVSDGELAVVDPDELKRIVERKTHTWL